MNDTFLVFTDEACAYNKLPSEPFRRSHPFYIRSNAYLSCNDYRVFQGEIQVLNKHYGIPVGEEAKWPDLWETKRGKFRAEFLKGLSEDKLKGYYRGVLQCAVNKDSLRFLFTVTCVLYFDDKEVVMLKKSRESPLSCFCDYYITIRTAFQSLQHLTQGYQKRQSKDAKPLVVWHPYPFVKRTRLPLKRIPQQHSECCPSPAPIATSRQL